MTHKKNKIRKIGILTFHFSKHNYGAVMQTYASFILINKLGLAPCVINLLQKENLLKTIKKQYRSILNSSYIFDRFRKKYLKMTKKAYDLQGLKNATKHIDMFYVGSDQVWRPLMSGSLLLHYYLDFVEDNRPKVSYAVSFGSAVWEGSPRLTEKIQPLIKRFSHVSVREREGVDICKDIFNVEAIHVLDPTLLLNSDDYNILIRKKDNNKFKDEKYCGIYLLTDRKGESNVFSDSRTQLNMKSVNLFGDAKMKDGKWRMNFRSVPEWLSGIKNASFIITDSYHCLIFSILYKKKFLCLLNPKGGISRIQNLLKLIGLEDRFCIDNIIDFKKCFNDEINYDIVNEKLREIKDISMEYLETCLFEEQKAGKKKV